MKFYKKTIETDLVTDITLAVEFVDNNGNMLKHIFNEYPVCNGIKSGETYVLTLDGCAFHEIGFGQGFLIVPIVLDK